MIPSRLEADEAYGGQKIDDPVFFARDRLRSDVWRTQAAILRSVANTPRTAVKACHASGKSYIAARAALWWITRWKDAICVTTAPTWTQVEKVLWQEIHRAVAAAKVRYPKPLQTELKLGPGNYALGLSTDEGVRFQGFHGEHVLIILDEAPGVDPAIYEAIEGIRAGGAVSLLALGNPVVSGGPFYDAFGVARSGWSTFTISAFDTPNFAGIPGTHWKEKVAWLLKVATPEERAFAPRPYLTTRQWVYERFHEWGGVWVYDPAFGREMPHCEHPAWISRVLGDFPPESPNQLISLRDIEAAAARPSVDAGGKLDGGLDVAGPGEDETVLYLRSGRKVFGPWCWVHEDPRGELLATLRPFLPRLEELSVDSAGIGYYLGRWLEDQGVPVRMVNVGESARDKEQFANLKAELYWGLRMRYSAGEIDGVTDPVTMAQLVTVQYEINSRGKVQIESKEDARKRGVKSPDRAEALMLAFSDSAAILRGVVTDITSLRGVAMPEEKPAKPGGFRAQVERMTGMDLSPPAGDGEHCKGCYYYRPSAAVPGYGDCSARAILTDGNARECELWEPVDTEDE